MSSPAAPPIPISVVRLGPEVEALVLEVVRSGTIAQGPVVRRLEEGFAEMIGARHVVAVNNGTTALVAALQVLDLRPGDEVVTSPFTFAATLNAILEAGATARFADIGADDFAIRADTIEPLVGERTAALLPVHLYGQCAPMAGIAGVAERHDLAVVEDAAQAHGAAVAGRSAGTWGTGCFSLYATKNLTSGEGGLISTDDDATADALRVLRNQGMRERYRYEVPGHNYRMTDLQAAVCVPQLAGYDAQVERRRQHARALSAGLAGIDGLRTPVELPGRRHVWHQYTVLVDDACRLGRDELVEELTRRGIGCGVYYPAVAFDHRCYLDHPRVVADEVPVARAVAARCLSLPVHAHLTGTDVERIVDAVRDAVGAGT